MVHQPTPERPPPRARPWLRMVVVALLIVIALQLVALVVFVTSGKSISGHPDPVASHALAAHQK